MILSTHATSSSSSGFIQLAVSNLETVTDAQNRVVDLIVEITVSSINSAWRIFKHYHSFFVLVQSLATAYKQVPALSLDSDISSVLSRSTTVRNALQHWLLQLARHDAVALSYEFREFLAASDDDLANPTAHHTVPAVSQSPMDFEVAYSAAHTDAAHLHTLSTDGLPQMEQMTITSDSDSVDGDHSPENEQKTINSSKRRSAVGLEDFLLLKVIGKGSFGKVMLVRKRDTQHVYAMKVLAKEDVIKRNQVEHTRTERNVLAYVRHPFIVTLRFAFQTKRKLYFVLDYCPGGELFFHLGRASKFEEARARFYAAQIVLALEYLHSRGIVYRDLKPENVLLDAEGNVALTDFGLSKEGISDNISAHSFCGTPEYLAPEILTRSGHGRAADWWSLGALLYEMLTGMPPFYSRNRDRLFEKILHMELRIPRDVSPQCVNILQGLLDRDPSRRLGSDGDGTGIRRHPFFAGIDWNALYNKQIQPPFKPPVSNLLDTSNFDAEFTNLPLDSDVRSSCINTSSISGGRFVGFTFINADSPQTHPAKAQPAQ